MGPKKRGDRGNCLIRLTQYLHCRQLQVFSKKKVRTQNQAPICQFLSPNSLICRLLYMCNNHNFFQKLRGTTGIFKVLRHKAQNGNLFRDPKIILGDPVWGRDP